jgi:malonyl-CoA/methylmalonyl-CoA synthetase
MLHVLPLHHVHGIVNALLCALASGASCDMPSDVSAEQIWARFASGQITMFTAVPTIYQKLIAAWERADPSLQRAWSDGAQRLRLMMSGSAALPLKTLERWREITGHTLLERYGMTEIGMALSNPLDGDRRAGFVGNPLPGVDVRLVDDGGVPVAEGATGEIEVRGPNVFLEYWKRPAETEQVFRDGWFRTGDSAVVDVGAYRILGRNSVDIIKSGGEKISALEIENALREHPAIGDCAVVGVPDETWGECVSVAIEPRPHATLSLGDLRAWAKPRLAPYKIPKALKIVDTLPRNALGKIVKSSVVSLFKSGTE